MGNLEEVIVYFCGRLYYIIEDLKKEIIAHVVQYRGKECSLQFPRTVVLNFFLFYVPLEEHAAGVLPLFFFLLLSIMYRKTEIKNTTNRYK